MPDRRRFLAGSLAVGVGPWTGWARAQGVEPRGEDDVAAEVEARMAWILGRYGDRLDEAARGAVRRDVEAQVRRARRLRAFRLGNGDGPGVIWVPYRAAADSA
ncbi:MAG: hypothetical protein KatS3mg108_3356 [Isosphaeraceae bacterium]|jgi:hypothetical protein|nr:MAG: hypothetical protein KatS3mg108_3356 [Isosphaeraceae bacterium]